MIINKKRGTMALMLAVFFAMVFLASGCGKKMPPKAPVETSMMDYRSNGN